MAEFDVGLIPFLVNPLTLATNPIKLYEYFACGMPVVSTALPEVASYAPLAYLAGSAEEFARQVSAALAEQDPERRAARRQVAQQESWETRVAELSGLIESR
jgi:glycosyltransferase involved in cell wall biosynthesis